MSVEPTIPAPDHVPAHLALPAAAAQPAIAPVKAFWRTALQVGPVAALGLLVILPQLLQSILDGFGRQLPPGIYAVLVSVTAALTLIAAIAARVMADTRVITWFRTYAPFFSPDAKP
jgi:hypothetical protein